MSNMNFRPEIQEVISRDDVFAIRDEINKVDISESLERYIIELVHATRYPLEYGLKNEAQFIQYGVSTRACIDLNLAAKALAFIDERDYVLPEDIKEMTSDVMNHRITLNYEAEAEGITSQEVITNILKHVPINTE